MSTSLPSDVLTEEKKDSGTSWLPYVLPMGLFMALTYAESYLPKAQYPLVYSLKALAVTVALIWAARAWRHEITFDGKSIALGVVAGIIGVIGWVGLNEYIPYPKLGSREALNPFESIDPQWRNAFLAVRFYGLAVMVPIMEEVFWRSWMLRYATDQDKWASLPIGVFSTLAFFIVCGLFAGVHPEWLVAFLFAALMAGLLHYTKSLTACIVAHAVTNLALGVYVLQTGDWKYW